MRQIFVLEEERLELEVRYMRTHSDLIEVTSFGSSWREWISSVRKHLELDATTSDGKKIQGTFEVVSQAEDGAIHIRRLNNILLMEVK